MTQFILSFLTTSAVMGLIILAVLGVRSIMPEKFSPKLWYMVWVIILVGLAVPLRPAIGGGLIVLNLPQAESLFDRTVEPGASAQNAPATDGTPLSERRVPISTIIMAVWLTVAAVIFLYHIWRYIRFSKLVKRWGIMPDGTALAVFQSVKSETVPQYIALKKCDFVSTSMLVGFLRPTVILPEKEFDTEELALIFRHELYHYRRGDMFVKLLSVAAISLNWFNPAVYLMNTALQADCEASCDEAVLRTADSQGRRFYAELIMEMVGGKKPATLLSTCFYTSKMGIKARMNAIMSKPRPMKKPLFVIPILLAALVAFSGSVFAVSRPELPYRYAVLAAELDELRNLLDTLLAEQKAEPIPAEEASAIALEYAGHGELAGIILFSDEGVLTYEADIRYGAARYMVYVNAVSGSVIGISRFEDEELIA